jgi:hypothetical protein
LGLGTWHLTVGTFHLRLYIFPFFSISQLARVLNARELALIIWFLNFFPTISLPELL